ncbi:MAG TPA: hypothetical protein VGJ80_00705 [Gemmatimonadales bacterium]|jgi:hypothetical protein
MNETHCHACGGFITDPAAVSYLPPVAGVVAAVPRTALCACNPAKIYGPPPGRVSAAMSARRN